MKKIIATSMALILVLLCSCSGGSDTIHPITREEGSGTRGAFVELLGIVDADDNDIIADSAEVTNSTSVMLSTVAGNAAAIGYVSLGSLSSDVKAVSVDGVEASMENINNGTYKLWRPFNVVYKEGNLSDLAKDFLNFILSDEGQAVIAEDGYIQVTSGTAYTASGLSGKITLAGSTSVAPVMDKLADAYKKLNPNVTIEIQQSGSSAGISSAIEGVCDMGMSSRELKESEAAELTSATIANDGIAIIVNRDNAVDSMTSQQIHDIFTGDLTSWDEVQK